MSCDTSETEGTYTTYDMIDQFFASSIYNTKWLRSSHGTRFVAGSGSDEPNFFKEYYNFLIEMNQIQESRHIIS